MTQPADIIRERINTFGPAWVEPPVLQPTGLYLELLGEAMRARAFTLAGSDELCLRPDMTAPAVRAAQSAGLIGPKGAKIAYDGIVFRRPPPGSKREAEHRQIGLEVFVPHTEIPQAEETLFAAALEAARACSVEPLVKLGDVGLFRAIVAASGLSSAHADAVVRGFSAAGGVAAALSAAEKPALAKEGALGRALAALDDPQAAAAAVEDLWAAARITPVGARTSAEVAERLKAKAAAARAPQPRPEQIGFIRAALAIEAAPDEALAALADLAKSTAGANAKALNSALAAAQTRWAGLAKLKPNARLSAGYGRGPGYYDGGLFEFEAPALGDLASLGGGGRYDAVLARLAGDAATGLSAAGFALRPQRLMLAREAGA